MIDYVLSLKESCIIIQGIRAGESTARAANGRGMYVLQIVFST